MDFVPTGRTRATLMHGDAKPMMPPLDGNLAKHPPTRVPITAARDHPSTSWLAAVLAGCCFAPRVAALQLGVGSVPAAGGQPDSPPSQPSLKPDAVHPHTLTPPSHTTLSQADSLSSASHTTGEPPHLPSKLTARAEADAIAAAIAVPSKPLVTAVAQRRVEHSTSPVPAAPGAGLEPHSSNTTVPRVPAVDASSAHTACPSALRPPSPDARPPESPVTIVVGGGSTSRPHGCVEVIHPRAPHQRPSPPLAAQRRVTEPFPSLHPPPPTPFSTPQPQPQPSAPTLTTANLASIRILEAEWSARRSSSKRNQLVQSWLHAAAEEAARPPAPSPAASPPPGLDLSDLPCSEDDELPRSVHGQHRSSDAGEGGSFPRRVAAQHTGGAGRTQANHQRCDDGGLSDPREPPPPPLQQQQQTLRRHPSSVQIHGPNPTTLTPLLDPAITPASSAVSTLPPPSAVQATDLRTNTNTNTTNNNTPYPALERTRSGREAATRQAQATAVPAGQVHQPSADAPALQQSQGSHRRQATPPMAGTPSCASLDTGRVAARTHRPVSRTLTSPTPFAQGRAASSLGLVAAHGGGHPHGPPPSSAHHAAHGPRVTLAPRGRVSISSEVTNGSLVTEHAPAIPARALAADSQNPALAERFRERARGAGTPAMSHLMPGQQDPPACMPANSQSKEEGQHLAGPARCPLLSSVQDAGEVQEGAAWIPRPPTFLHRVEASVKPIDDSHMPSGASGSRTRTIAVASHCPEDIATPIWSVEGFTLLKKLYEGNLSVVCQAVHRVSGRHVALKIYKRSRLHEMERFQLAREICLHIRVLHPSVVALFAAWKDAKYVYLALEWAPCGNLFDHLVSRGGKLRERDAAANVIRPLLTALAFLHAQQFIHRDVKLENIIMDAHGAIKLADFGLAIDQKYEQANTRLGTFGYFAPEVLDCPLKKGPFDSKDASLRGYDSKVDVWSAGVVAFEVLTGRAPFSASSATKIIEAIRTRVLELPTHLSAEAQDFIVSALTRDPAQRASAEQLLQHPWLNKT
ncbi:MAG: hypothetical protein WDW36_009755 [Sanguina aurantia]